MDELIQQIEERLDLIKEIDNQQRNMTLVQKHIIEMQKERIAELKKKIDDLEKELELYE